MNLHSIKGIVLLVDNCNFGKIKTFDIPMLGKTIKQWVSLAFGETPVTYIENDRAKEIPELVREFLDDSEYTVILYSDTPLIQRKTVLEALEFTQKRGLNVCRMTRGYIFKTDFLRLQETLPENKRYYFSEEDDFICAADFKQLSLISEIMRRRILHHYMNNGVYVMDESTTYIDGDVVIESGVTIYPNNIIKGKTVIKSGVTLMQGNSIENCVIDSDAVITNSNLSTSYIGEGTSVGPFAYIRPETVVGKKCRIGDFVEIKKSKIGDHSKVSHLAYIGDSVIGGHCNIGCGVITANYDGKHKFATVIGDNVFVGSNSVLIAPVKLDDNCFVAAGSTITSDVDAYALAIARERQVNKPDWNRK